MSAAPPGLGAARNALDGIYGFLGLSVPEGSVRNPSGSLVRTVLDTGAGEGLDGILDASSRAIIGLADVYLPSLPAEDRLSLTGRLENLVALRAPGAPIPLDGVSDVLGVARGDLDGNHNHDVLLVTRDSIVFLEVGPDGIERSPGRDLNPRKEKYEGRGAPRARASRPLER